ncbi:MAG: cyclase family protein [Gemmatimonadales bacterium]
MPAHRVALGALLLGLGELPLSAQTIDLSRYEMVDLTHALNARTVFWPTSEGGFELQRIAFGPTPGGWFYAANAFAMPEHGGTHLDAPIHFAEGGATADRVPLDRLVLPAVVIDVSAKAAKDPDYRLTPDDVRAFERRHGTIPAGAAVVLRTGWDQRWPDRRPIWGMTPRATRRDSISRASVPTGPGSWWKRGG